MATEKLKGPSTSLTFLGIILDTHCMEICLPKDKLQCILQELSLWLHRKTATKRDILSLIGFFSMLRRLSAVGGPLWVEYTVPLQS